MKANRIKMGSRMLGVSDIGAKNVEHDTHLRRREEATKKLFATWQFECMQMGSTFVKLGGT
jgi:hypothetical protein